MCYQWFCFFPHIFFMKTIWILITRCRLWFLRPTNGFLVFFSCVKIHAWWIKVHNERLNPGLWDIIVVTITFWINQATLSLLLFNFPISSKVGGRGGLFFSWARLINLIRKLTYGRRHHFYTAHFNLYLWLIPFFVHIISRAHKWHRYDAITRHNLVSHDCWCFTMNP